MRKGSKTRGLVNEIQNAKNGSQSMKFGMPYLFKMKCAAAVVAAVLIGGVAVAAAEGAPSRAHPLAEVGASVHRDLSAE